MNNEAINNSTEKKIPVLALIRANIILIIIVVALGVLGGYFLGKKQAKTVYTAGHSVILRMTTSVNVDSSETINNATLVKLYLPTVSYLLSQDVFVEKANEIYYDEYKDEHNLEEGTKYIYGGDVGTSYNDESLIFSVSYSDPDSTFAKEKLECIIDGFNEIMASEDGVKYLKANNVSLVDLQNGRCTVSSSNGSRKYVIMGTIIGVVVAVVIVGIKYIFDNTVKSKEEFEELTGITVLSYIKKV